jgi:hypothetical protein
MFVKRLFPRSEKAIFKTFSTMNANTNNSDKISTMNANTSSDNITKFIEKLTTNPWSILFAGVISFVAYLESKFQRLESFHRDDNKELLQNLQRMDSLHREDNKELLQNLQRMDTLHRDDLQKMESLRREDMQKISQAVKDLEVESKVRDALEKRKWFN